MDLTGFYERARIIGVDITDHLPDMVNLVIAMDAKQIIEIGVGNGNSSSAWLMGLAQTGGHLWSVDICPTDLAIQLNEFVPDWTYWYGDSLTEHFQAPYDADILFIDSEHSYDQTIAELDLYTPHVRSGGVIWLHDTDTDHAEVRPALDDWCASRGLSWSNRSGCYGMGMVQL